MNININRRFHNELFEEKKVLYHSTLYKNIYNKIWPCEDYFRKFLQVSDNSVRLDYAKKIYKYLQMYDDIEMPFFAIEKLIKVQQNNLATNNLYIPQDHLIHSIHLYILGVYLFFNISLFHDKLIEYSYGKNICEKICSFVYKWRLFAFYHDIGYVFESLINKESFIKGDNIDFFLEYFNMNETLLRDYTMRIVARLIINYHHINISKSKFVLENNLINSISWRCNGREIDSRDVINTLVPFKEYINLKNISTIEDFSSFLGMLQKNTYLIEYINTYGAIIAYVIKNEDNVKIIYNSEFKNDYPINMLLYNNYVLCADDIEFRVYVKNPNSLWSLLPLSCRYEASCYYNALPQSIKSEISLNSKQYNLNYQCVLIKNWLSEKNKDESATESIEETVCFKHSIKAAITELLNNSIKEVLDNNVIERKNLDEVIKKYKKRIDKITPENVNILASKYYSDNEGINEIIFYCYNYFATQIGKWMQNYGYFIFLEKNKLGQIQYKITVPINDDYYAMLCSRIKQLCKDLKIDINKLVNYHPEHSSFDHGIVSAFLLMQIIVFFRHLYNCSEDNKILRLAWTNWSSIHNTNVEQSAKEYGDVIFSIALHNIYSVKVKPKFGMEYKQNIDKNPFSYFCALSDTIQKWGRPKQIDFSSINMPEENFLGNDYDIEIIEDRIKIKCNSIQSGNMRAEINKLEDYLEGASYLFRINEDEE